MTAQRKQEYVTSDGRRIKRQADKRWPKFKPTVKNDRDLVLTNIHRVFALETQARATDRFSKRDVNKAAVVVWCLVGAVALVALVGVV